VPVPEITIDFSDDQDTNTKTNRRNYHEELDKALKDFNLGIQNLVVPSETPKNFLYAELLASNTIKKSHQIIKDMVDESIKDKIKPD
jgi:hypothetical protein